MAVPRWRAEVGMLVRLKVRFEQNQVTLYDPASISQVEILDDSGTVIDTITVGITREATGIWYIDWQIPTTLTPGMYHDRWTYTPYAGYGTITGTADFAVFAAGAFSAATSYLSVDDARSMYLPSGTTLTDSQISFLCQMASSFADQYCGQRFVPWIETIQVDGTGKPYLFLPRAYLVRSLTSLSVLSNGDSTALTVGDFRFRDNMIIHRSFQRWPRRSGTCFPIICTGDSDIFTAGVMNIEVEGQFGAFATVPDLIVHAVGLMVRNGGADDSIHAPWIANYSTEVVDTQSVTMRNISPLAKVKTGTGIPEVDAILQNYMNRRGRVMVP